MRRSISILASLVLVLGACGDDEPGAGSDPAPELAGRAFVSESATGRQLVDGTEVTLSFEEASLSANAGCNTMNGAYTVDGDTMTLSEGAISTMMACEQELMEQDEWLVSFLSGGVEVSGDGERITLTAGDVTVEMVEQG